MKMENDRHVPIISLTIMPGRQGAAAIDSLNAETITKLLEILWISANEPMVSSPHRRIPAWTEQCILLKRLYPPESDSVFSTQQNLVHKKEFKVQSTFLIDTWTKNQLRNVQESSYWPYNNRRTPKTDIPSVIANSEFSFKTSSAIVEQIVT